MTRTGKLIAAMGLLTLPAGLQAATLEVRDGATIQDAVNRASAGDTILVYPGTYVESVYIDKDRITLRGVVEANEWPTLDGEKVLNDAILYSGNDITVEWLKIVGYKGNAIMGQAGNNFVIRYNKLSEIEDAAIYVGMCDNVDVRNNEVFGNVAGIEIENSRHAIVEANYVHHNTGGILAFITPGLPIKTTFDVIIRNNFVVDNNTPNFGAPGSIVSGIPAGTGILVMAADDVTIEGNIITGNNTAGIVITDLSYAANVSNDPESEPNPDRIAVLDNFMDGNGNDAAAEVKALMVATSLSTRGPDIIAVGGGEDSDNCILNAGPYRVAGIGKWTTCETATTAATLSYMLPDGAPSRSTDGEDKAKLLYRGICAGCHGYDVRMVGPATVTIQALYGDDAQALADYIAKPVKKRPDYPEMPPQSHLPADLRLQVAEYMLKDGQ